MAHYYTSEELRYLFQAPFKLESWTQFLKEYIQPQILRVTPEPIELKEGKGYYLGTKRSEDDYEIALFYAELTSSVQNRRVGLRQLVQPFLRYAADAALVVYDDGTHWRLSFICDLKGEETSPRRFTFLFGDRQEHYNTPVSRFLTLQEEGISFLALQKAFSVEALTKQFYRDLFEWYEWATSEEARVTFPNNTNIAEDDRENIDVKVIRLITRLMFVWFIKQKQLVPDAIFHVTDLKQILKDFDPQSEKDGSYYNAILQNLFFATLNRAIQDEEGNGRGFAKRKDKDLKTLYRYEELFAISQEEVIELFAEVPFLNGGLFECLDKTKTLDGVPKAFGYDGFSRSAAKFADGRYKHRAFIPNQLFFKPEKGLFEILNRYNFTIEENAPDEQQVALDPELLGKVFENLLGAYNPETRETARNRTGSFYTPREIVNYMVDESLKAYLHTDEAINRGLVEQLLNNDFSYHEEQKAQYQIVAQKLQAIKVLDPACGSGAYPMGLLNRLVQLLGQLQPHQSSYRLKLQIIENCIYGCDLQSIATQITKLRFFISLICDCEKDITQADQNFGIPTLPNLETKFVSANSLFAIKNPNTERSLFDTMAIDEAKARLKEVRHQHFSARSASAKSRLRQRDQELRQELIHLLATNHEFSPEDAKRLAEWNPYDQNEVADFFDPEWMFGLSEGFDIVIGNPPYIQLQNNGGELADIYKDCGFHAFARTGDIYCLFYERGHQLLKDGGHLCYITSNKWMRAAYGEKLRDFLAQHTNPEILIDFAGVQVFESATVDTNILLLAKASNRDNCLAATAKNQQKNGIPNLKDFLVQEGTPMPFSSAEAWVILSPIEQSIKQKIEAVGTPLKEWDIQIYRGILTGCNEAFIITTEKRDEILSQCQSEEERERTAQLIRPILRGKDIKRYTYNWANLWIINTHNGIPGRLPRIKIEEYPAVKQHLEQYWDKIERRSDQGDTPYNLRSCAYTEDFERPKIVYSEIVQAPQFYLDLEGEFYPEATCFIMTGEQLEFLYHLFHSKTLTYLFRTFYAGGGLGGHGYRYKKAFFQNLPIPRSVDASTQEELITLCTAHSGGTYDIEGIIGTLYGLSGEEKSHILRAMGTNE